VAFEEAADHFEKRMRRYKRKLKSHGTGAGNGSATDVAYTVVAAVGDDDEEVPEDFAPAIVAESTMALKTMSVASAVIELDTKDSPVFVFRNAGNDGVNVVYRGRTAISAGLILHGPVPPRLSGKSASRRVKRLAAVGCAKDLNKWISAI
jgi:hypothetical protein